MSTLNAAWDGPVSRPLGESLAWLGWKDSLSALKLCVCSECWIRHGSCVTIILLTNVGFTTRHQLLSSPVELSEFLAHKLT